jgi:hexosaminidase
VWSEFLNIVGKRELPRLDHYAGGYSYRIPTPGIVKENGQIIANVQFPGFVIRYTTDGTEPTANSSIYTAPLNSKGTVQLKAFNAEGRAGRTVMIENSY